MKLLGLGSELSGGKVTQITKNGLTITKPDGKMEVISLTEAERRVSSFSSFHHEVKIP